MPVFESWRDSPVVGVSKTARDFSFNIFLFPSSIDPSKRLSNVYIVLLCRCFSPPFLKIFQFHTTLKDTQSLFSNPPLFLSDARGSSYLRSTTSLYYYTRTLSLYYSLSLLAWWCFARYNNDVWFCKGRERERKREREGEKKST